MPVRPDEYDAAIRAILEDAGPDFVSTSNIFGTLLRVPVLTKDYRRFGDVLRRGELPPRDREILVLRTAWRCGCPYEWAQHVRVSRSVGMTDEEITSVAHPSENASWSAFQRTLVRAADELHEDACLSEMTWSELATVYDERQMIELLMLVGNYTLLSYVMNSVGVEPEAGSDPMPEGPFGPEPPTPGG